MTRINKMLAKWLPGEIHTLRWFEKRGASQRVAFGYSKSGALRKIGSGVFSLPDDPLNWLGAVKAMQEELGLPVHVGARSSLELQGTSHNIVQSKRPHVTLIASDKTTIPAWVKVNDWNALLAFKQSSLISGEQSLTEFAKNGISVRLSSREQAILEFIDSLDLSVSFQTVADYLSSLMTLRPKVLQDLLKRCSSVKVKRVFLYLAESMELPFFSKLDLAEIDLGSGKRVIIKGGRYDAKYQITVPKEKGESNVGF